MQKQNCVLLCCLYGDIRKVFHFPVRPYINYKRVWAKQVYSFPVSHSIIIVHVQNNFQEGE